MTKETFLLGGIIIKNIAKINLKKIIKVDELEFERNFDSDKFWKISLNEEIFLEKFLNEN